MKVYLDDKRHVPPGWVGCLWPDEVIALLRAGNVEALSLDHDLGDDNRGTGYHVILWLEEQVALHGFDPPASIEVHSDNGPGRDRMLAGVRSIRRFHRQREEA